MHQDSTSSLGKHGGPPKDGIPSIDNPQFDTAATTPFNWQQTVIGVVVNGEAKAYPFGIMNWHEIVKSNPIALHLKTISITKASALS